MAKKRVVLGPYFRKEVAGVMAAAESFRPGEERAAQMFAVQWLSGPMGSLMVGNPDRWAAFLKALGPAAVIFDWTKEGVVPEAYKLGKILREILDSGEDLESARVAFAKRWAVTQARYFLVYEGSEGVFLAALGEFGCYFEVALKEVREGRK